MKLAIDEGLAVPVGILLLNELWVEEARPRDLTGKKLNSAAKLVKAKCVKQRRANV
jgi:hypothetical protein